jgi:UDP-2,3-diacylglucosamine pyrophosphatase LpxH
MALREALKERASLNDFELHNSPIHELIQYSLERSESMRKRMEEAWTSGGALSAILSGVDEMTDRKGVIGWIVRRLYKGSLKKKPNAMRGAEIDERIIGDMEKCLRLSGAPTSDWFVYGHTHVPEGRKREGGFSIVNTGSWFEDADTIHNTYVVIDDEVVIRRLGEATPCWP